MQLEIQYGEIADRIETSVREVQGWSEDHAVLDPRLRAFLDDLRTGDYTPDEMAERMEKFYGGHEALVDQLGNYIRQHGKELTDALIKIRADLPLLKRVIDQLTAVDLSRLKTSLTLPYPAPKDFHCPCEMKKVHLLARQEVIIAEAEARIALLEEKMPKTWAMVLDAIVVIIGNLWGAVTSFLTWWATMGLWSAELVDALFDAAQLIWAVVNFVGDWNTLDRDGPRLFTEKKRMLVAMFEYHALERTSTSVTGPQGR